MSEELDNYLFVEKETLAQGGVRPPTLKEMGAQE